MMRKEKQQQNTLSHTLSSFWVFGLWSSVPPLSLFWVIRLQHVRVYVHRLVHTFTPFCMCIFVLSSDVVAVTATRSGCQRNVCQRGRATFGRHTPFAWALRDVIVRGAHSLGMTTSSPWQTWHVQCYQSSVLPEASARCHRSPYCTT